MSYSRLSVAEVAGRVGVTRKTVYQWIKIGRMPPSFKQPGKALFFYRFSIDAWERKNGFAIHTTSLAEPAEAITLDDLAGRWKITAATVRELSKLHSFPQLMDVSLYDRRRVEAVEAAHGSKEKFVQWVKGINMLG